MLKKILSYLVPVIILKQKSNNKSVEVTWKNGQLVIDTENTNYSYGSLQRILRKGLLEIGFKKIKTFKKILILGVAGGSVIKTINDEINFNGKITGVELDATMINIANTYFNLEDYKNLEIIIDNAEYYVKNNSYKYDLIVINIFQDNYMPEFLFENNFVRNFLKILNKNGFVVFNTMVLTAEDEIRNSSYIALFDKEKFTISTIPNLEGFNELIIIEKC